MLAFGLADAVCFACVLRARRISADDTGRGLVSLLLLRGGWSISVIEAEDGGARFEIRT